MITRHAPDPLHVRETLCGAALVPYGRDAHHLVELGMSITCPECRVVINMATKCVAPNRYRLVKAP